MEGIDLKYDRTYKWYEGSYVIDGNRITISVEDIKEKEEKKSRELGIELIKWYEENYTDIFKKILLKLNSMKEFANNKIILDDFNLISLSINKDSDKEIWCELYTNQEDITIQVNFPRKGKNIIVEIID